MDVLLQYLKAFAVGGLLCVIGQLLIDYTKLTPARILTSYVVAGVILGALEYTSRWPIGLGRVRTSRSRASETPSQRA